MKYVVVMRGNFQWALRLQPNCVNPSESTISPICVQKSIHLRVQKASLPHRFNIFHFHAVFSKSLPNDRLARPSQGLVLPSAKWVAGGMMSCHLSTVADPGGPRGAMPPGPVKISHKKDGCRRQPHRFHVSRPPPYPAAGSATEVKQDDKLPTERELFRWHLKEIYIPCHV